MSVFIDKLTDFYKAMPYGPGFTRNLSPLIEQLSAEMQEHAANQIIRSRKAKGWPSLTECETALRAALEPPRSVVGPAGAWQSSAEVKSEFIARQQARIQAFKLCRCPMGRAAHEDRWLNALVDFATDKGRLPHGNEVTALKALARRNDEAAQAASAQFPMFATMREAMHERAYRDVFEFIDNQAA